MLRRYLITNGISTAIMYGAYLAVVPSLPNLLSAVGQSVDAMAMESSFLGPIFHRIVSVSCDWTVAPLLVSADR